VEFADVVLPDAHDYERWDLFPANDPYAFITPGPGEWFWLMRQPALQAPPGVRPWNEQLLDLAERAGFLDDLYEVGNTVWGIDPAYRLERGRKYSVRDIAERQARTIVGPQFSVDQLTESACIVTREKTLEEAYPRPFFDARAPIYFEHMLNVAEQVRAVAERIGLAWDVTPYTPLLRFIPCHALEEDGEHDLLIVNFKVPFHTFSVSGENPWIDELSVANPYTYHVMINSRTAARKRLEDGDRVLIRSRYGEEEGTLRVTELIHPDCLGIPGTFGHWAQKKSVSAGKGSSFNNLLPPPSLERIDPITGQVDTCVRVKLEKR
jgi:anaerobic selenocysteine-containing dehydrogenase